MMTNANFDSLTDQFVSLGALQDSATATQGWESRGSPRVWPGLPFSQNPEVNGVVAVKRWQALKEASDWPSLG